MLLFFGCTHCVLTVHLIGQKLQRFTQLKRNKRFDNFIMLVWVQGSPFHIAARSHPVQEAWGSQDSLYRGQIQKFLQCCQKPYHQIPLVIHHFRIILIWPGDRIRRPEHPTENEARRCSCDESA